jgi:2-methylisocitrate lyase-like PEP mutase family enzyme
MTGKQQNAAQIFHQLHEQGLLLLANAWDAGSARLIESLGAKALATTSAGVAWSHGYADGDHLPVRLLIATVTEIARVVSVPLSVDIEAGYSDDPAAVGNVVADVIEAGGVGVNIEDGTGKPDLLCAKIEQAKSAGVRLGVDLFVNARTDVYLRGLVSGERRIDETVARSERYQAAGADGIFVPGVSNADEIEAIASSVRLPLNVLAWPGLPPAPELESLGVRRLSAGSGITQVVYSKIAALATGFLQNGASDPLAEGVMPYAEINALFGAK